jgi:hypothetical protein
MGDATRRQEAAERSTSHGVATTWWVCTGEACAASLRTTERSPRHGGRWDASQGMAPGRKDAAWGRPSNRQASNRSRNIDGVLCPPGTPAIRELFLALIQGARGPRSGLFCSLPRPLRVAAAAGFSSPAILCNARDEKLVSTASILRLLRTSERRARHLKCNEYYAARCLVPAVHVVLCRVSSPEPRSPDHSSSGIA